jgi:hypothetical protein
MNHPKLDIINKPDSAAWILGENKDKKKREEKILLGETNRIIFEGKSKLHASNSNLSEYKYLKFLKN